MSAVTSCLLCRLRDPRFDRIESSARASVWFRGKHIKDLVTYSSTEIAIAHAREFAKTLNLVMTDELVATVISRQSLHSAQLSCTFSDCGRPRVKHGAALTLSQTLQWSSGQHWPQEVCTLRLRFVKDFNAQAANPDLDLDLEDLELSVRDFSDAMIFHGLWHSGLVIGDGKVEIIERDRFIPHQYRLRATGTVELFCTALVAKRVAAGEASSLLRQVNVDHASKARLLRFISLPAPSLYWAVLEAAVAPMSPNVSEMRHSAAAAV